MLLEALTGQVRIPEALYRSRDRRVDTVIIGQNALGLGSHHSEVFAGPLHMRCKLFLTVHAVKVLLSKGRHLCYRVLNAVEIII